MIMLDSKGPAIFKQKRAGKDLKPFDVFKFRTMEEGSEGKGLITCNNDKRITRLGKHLRKYKLDELPQLFNVVKGDMSFVGPRPQPPEDVNRYSEKEKLLLSVKPGITSLASIKYSDEEYSLPDDPKTLENLYFKSVLPKKLACDLEYIQHPDFLVDIKIIISTILLILGKILAMFLPNLRHK
jgi:lipopolysaccharide/colanic/teichoic acid biosynthesis glycosyltransferase